MERTVDLEFLPRTSALDWGLVRSADLRLGDLTTLQPVMDNLLAAELQRSDLELLADQKVVKAFKLCQLGMEALSVTQKRLCLDIESLQALRERQRIQTQSLESDISESSGLLSSLEDRMARQSKALSARGNLAKQSMSSKVLTDTMLRANAMPCPHCGKLFQSAHYLNKHKERRHPEPSSRPEDDFRVLLQQFQSTFAEQLQQTAAKHTRELEHLQAEYESKIASAETPTPLRHQHSEPTTPRILEEFLASQQQLRQLLAARPQASTPTSPPATPEDSAWLDRLESTISQLVSTNIKQRLPPPKPIQAPIPVEEPIIQPVVLEPPPRFYPESTITSNAGEIDDDSPSPREWYPLDSRAGEIEDDEKDEEELAEVVEMFEEAPISESKPGQMTEVRSEVEEQEDVCTEGSVALSASDLGLDLDAEPQFAYVVRTMLKTQVPGWRAELQGSRVLYTNTATGQRSSAHPALSHFAGQLGRLRSKKWKHETRDFLLALFPHTNDATREAQTSLFEHSSEEIAHTRTELSKNLLRTAKTPMKQSLPAKIESSVTAGQGFVSELTLLQLVDPSTQLKARMQLIEGETVARGTVALNDLKSI